MEDPEIDVSGGQQQGDCPDFRVSENGTVPFGAAEQPHVRQAEPQPAPFQFGLQGMFVVMTVAAICLSMIFQGPPWLSVLTAVLLAAAAPMVLTTVLVYGRGRVRTFCIGGLFPAGVILMWVPSPLVSLLYRMTPPGNLGRETNMWVGIATLVSLLVIVGFGFLALGVRWLVESAQRRQAAESARAAGGCNVVKTGVPRETGNWGD